MRRLLQWFLGQRTATRVAFVLQISCRVLYSLFSLLWTPLLLSSMGKNLNGLFLNFQKMASLGIVGDLGMGTLINIRTSRLLGQGKERELHSFLAATRTVYLALAMLVAGVFLVISPQLFHALHFGSDPTVGPLGILSLVGATAIMMVVLNSYITNLNFGCGNVVWPVVPTFVVAQCAVLGHWLLALRQAPLWLQFTPYVGAAVMVQLFGWVFVRLSHPALAMLRPLHFQRSELVDLGVKSFWVYLYTIGAGIYTTTDTFLITAGFGAEWVPTYQYNFRLCDLAFYVVFSAGQASLPKLTQWIASSDPAAHRRGIQEAVRLNKFQTLLGCCAVYVYLNCNDWFMSIWLGKGFHAPLAWQSAFAVTLGVNAAGLMGSDLLARCCERGIRIGGVSGLGFSIINFILAFVAMKAHSIFGIALALSAVMTTQNLLLGWFTSRELKISWWSLSLRNCLIALVFVGLGLLAKTSFPSVGPGGFFWPLLVSPVVFVLAAWLAGISVEDLRQEAKIFQGLLGGAKPPPSQAT